MKVLLFKQREEVSVVFFKPSVMATHTQCVCHGPPTPYLLWRHCHDLDHAFFCINGGLVGKPGDPLSVLCCYHYSVYSMPLIEKRIIEREGEGRKREKYVSSVSIIIVFMQISNTYIFFYNQLSPEMAGREWRSKPFSIHHIVIL